MNSLSIEGNGKVQDTGDTMVASTPTARAATVELSQSLTHSASLPYFLTDDISVSPKRTLSHDWRPHRESVEHSVCGHDIVQHIHGVSPFHARERLRPSRLQMSNQTPLHESSSGLPDPISHAPRIISQTPSYSVLETPLPTRSVWGSQPVQGKDWGQSRRCGEGIISLLLNHLETACGSSDHPCGGESPTFSGNRSSLLDCSATAAVAVPAPSLPSYPSSSCFVHHPNISEEAVKPADLGIDFEADGAPKSEAYAEEENYPFDEFDRERDSKRKVIVFAPSRRHTCLGLTPMPNHVKSAGVQVPTNLKIVDKILALEKLDRRRQRSYAKHKRISLCATALESGRVLRPPKAGCNTLGEIRKNLKCDPAGDMLVEKLQTALSPFPRTLAMGKTFLATPTKGITHRVLRDSKALGSILSFLREHDLLCSVSLVCSAWADAATHAHASLSLISVGCSPSLIDGKDFAKTCCSLDDDDGSLGEDGSDNQEAQLEKNSIALSMERPWKFLLNKFPWAMFLSEGAYKRVYKVWNSSVQAEEAVSVM